MSTSAKVPAGHFKILYFASAGSYTAKDSEHLPAPLPIAKLFEMLEERYNGMKSKVLESCLVTVNLEYVDVPEDADAESDFTIKEGDEVAIIPPKSTIVGLLPYGSRLWDIPECAASWQPKYTKYGQQETHKLLFARQIEGRYMNGEGALSNLETSTMHRQYTSNEYIQPLDHPLLLSIQ